MFRRSAPTRPSGSLTFVRRPSCFGIGICHAYPPLTAPPATAADSVETGPQEMPAERETAMLRTRLEKGE